MRGDYAEGQPATRNGRVAGIMDRTDRAVHNLCRRGLEELHVVLGRSSKYLTRK